MTPQTHAIVGLVTVDIKAAVSRAMEFAKNSLGPERTTNLRLEEIESSTYEGNPVWLITLSNALSPAFEDKERLMENLRAAAAALSPDAPREYKVFTVAKENGEVLSMKIRVLEIPAMR